MNRSFEIERLTEFTIAFRDILDEMRKNIENDEGVPSANSDDFMAYQQLVLSIISLQKELDVFLDTALSHELSLQETPIQILDFTAELDKFKK